MWHHPNQYYYLPCTLLLQLAWHGSRTFATNHTHHHELVRTNDFQYLTQVISWFKNLLIMIGCRFGYIFCPKTAPLTNDASSLAVNLLVDVFMCGLASKHVLLRQMWQKCKWLCILVKNFCFTIFLCCRCLLQHKQNLPIPRNCLYLLRHSINCRFAEYLSDINISLICPSEIVTGEGHAW